MTYFVNTSSEAPCRVCGRTQQNRPAIFRGEDWCSGKCRKAIVGEQS